MQSLFQDGLTQSDIRRLLATNLTKPLLPPRGSTLWRQRAGNPTVRFLTSPLIEAAQAEASQPLPKLTDDLYAEFHRSGNRLQFEDPYFERRRRLARSAIALLLKPDDNAVMERSFVDKFTDVAEEESWALPAHVGAMSGKDPLCIDLFAAETANTMAEALDLFGPLIPMALSNYVRDRLRTTVFENYVDNRERFGWATSENNWNAVCHQGVLGAALAVETDTDLLARMLAIAAKKLPRFLSGFGVDGGTAEGPGYWSYGFGWFSVLNEQLETATNGALSLFEGDPHIDEIAMFGTRMSLSSGWMVNFSDGSARGEVNPRLLSYLGGRLNNDTLRQHGLSAFCSLAVRPLEFHFERADLFYFTRLIRDWPSELPEIEYVPAADFYFRDIEVIVARRTDLNGHLWEFAAKGGNNAEPHNHNDCGSYLINIDGVPLAIEIGAPEYTREFFGPKRYEHLAARSLGHSLPFVNGCEQNDGTKFAANVLEHQLEPNRVRFVVDLSACYPAEASIRSLVRSIEFDMSGKFCVRDSYELGAETNHIETSIITSGTVAVSGDCAMIETDGRRMLITPDSGTSITAVEEHGYSDHAGLSSTVRMIVLLASEPRSVGSLGYNFSME